MKVLVIMATYNGADWLDTCLNGLFKSTVPLDLVVVDNHSTDNTLEILQHYPLAKLFALQENLGFGKANNIGMKYTLEQHADYVLLLNQDAYLRPDTVERLLEVSRRHPTYFVLSPLHLDGTEKKLDINFQHYVSPQNCTDFLSDLALQNGNLREVYEILFVNAAIWLMPIACLRLIGGFDPIFSHYGEDNDYIKRVRYHGFQVGICPYAFAIHDRQQRNDFGDDALGKQTLHKLKTDALVKLKNVNAPLGEALWKVFGKAIKRTVKSIFLLNLPEVSKQMKLLIFTTWNLAEIRRHRRISEQPEGLKAWLDKQL